MADCATIYILARSKALEAIIRKTKKTFQIQR